MTKVLTSRGWLAAFAAAILCLAAAFGTASTANAQNVSNLTIGSATTEPNGDVTVALTMSGTGVGSYGVNIEYDGTLVSATACTSTNGVCNTAFATETVRINGSNLQGIGGTDVSLGTITFHAGGQTGTAALTISSVALSDTQGNDLTVTPTNGTITIATATASPTPAPTASGGPSGSATASASPTPRQLPQTGGEAGDSFQLGWIAAAAGLLVVAAGAWTLTRAREDN